MPRKIKIDVGVFGPMTDCKCPKCGRVHQMRIMWIGRGMPRKFCGMCKDNTAEIDQVHAVEFHKPRMFPGFVPGN